MSEPVAAPSSETELQAHVERILASQYELERELGRGGMGIVYRARDRRLKRVVAIKLLPPEFAFRGDIKSRFLREAETAAQLSHPNIVPIYSVDEREGLVYFVMACIDGDNLAKVMHDQGRIGADETRRIVRDVADALAYAHSRGVVHRDIKPDNILLDQESGRPMITDFGIARAAEAGTRLTATGMAIGTPAYMAPEQAAGEREVDGRTDLYALGIVAYQMLIGELPFTASTPAAMLVKHINERPVPVAERRPEVPPDLARAVMMLLEKEPDDRFPSAGSLVVALDSGEVPERASSGASAAALLTHGTAARSRAPSRPSVPAPVPVDDEELERWQSHEVIAYRRKLATYLSVNFVLVLLSVFANTDLFFITAFWTVYVAFQYAKLWSKGYDWRDVFKQPKDRLFADVVAETIDDSVALFDPKKRDALRERRRTQGSTGGLRVIFEGSREKALPAGARRTGGPAPVDPAMAGQHAGVVQQARGDRDEVRRLVAELPPAQKQGLPDVVASAEKLAERVEQLAVNLAELERADVPDALASLDREVATLEAQANPLEGAVSEERVRRLAQLRRQRRALVDVARRRERAAAKLETCRLALRNMRYDVLRLRTGAQSQEQVTTMVEQARALAQDVDGALYAADELARLSPPRGR